MADKLTAVERLPRMKCCKRCDDLYQGSKFSKVCPNCNILIKRFGK